MIFKKVFLLIRNHIDQMSWQAVLAIISSHILLTWVALWFAGEQALTEWHTFFYYYVVTTSTVGYGDFSATTELGRWLVAIVQIPLGLALFGVLLGKTGQFVTHLVRRSMTGEKDFAHLGDHIIIFGWHASRTSKMIQYILADKKRLKRRILLAVTEEMTHPFLDKPEVDFVRLSSFTDLAELARCAVKDADRIIIDGVDDNQTFTTALRVSPLVKPSCHISAHFTDDSKLDMLRAHCENVECSSAKSAEILVRSMQDPGSSRVQEELLSTLKGDTQFSVTVPDGVKDVPFKAIFFAFKSQYDAIVLGVAHGPIGRDMDLNPPLDYPINSGDVLHYIAPERVLADDIRWQALADK